jgi:hypothetical protein
MKVYAFNKTDDPSYGWLSNMSPHPVLYNGVNRPGTIGGPLV